MDWCVGRIETLCIVSKIGLQLMKMAHAFVEARKTLLRYLGWSLLVIIMTIWEELILRTWGDYIATHILWDCISGGWSFYLIGIGTYNVLVLYRESLKKEKKIMTNVVDFKISLVESLTRPKLAGVPDARLDQKLMRSESRKQCAYCAMVGKWNRTRFKYGKPICNIPLCYLGSYVEEDGCFSISHSNDQIIRETHAKYVQIK